MATDRYPGARDRFVLVAGWPGSGKSTLAAALATGLGLPLLSKDVIKEALIKAAVDHAAPAQPTQSSADLRI